MSKAVPPAQRGQYWRRKRDNFSVRVLCLTDGYVVVRIPRCIPFCVLEREFYIQFEPIA